MLNRNWEQWKCSKTYVALHDMQLTCTLTLLFVPVLHWFYTRPGVLFNFYVLNRNPWHIPQKNMTYFDFQAANFAQMWQIWIHAVPKTCTSPGTVTPSRELITLMSKIIHFSTLSATEISLSLSKYIYANWRASAKDSAGFGLWLSFFFHPNYSQSCVLLYETEIRSCLCGQMNSFLFPGVRVIWAACVFLYNFRQ